MKKLYIKILSVFTVTFLGYQSALAAIITPTKPENLPDISMDKLVVEIVRLIMGIGQIAFVIVLLYGGVLLITSAGNQEQAEKAKKLMTYAVLGVIVLFSAWAIASYILSKLK